MRILLDTHVLLWWLLGNETVPLAVRAAIADNENEVFVSAASVWEISIKYKRGKLPTAAVLIGDLDKLVARRGFSGLAITLDHGDRAGSLPLLHKDPFDRMLIAQAMVESLTLVSNERLFDRYGVARLW
ncbi:MAG TPA: type II toxin-antitoxin system VapC family toxin [Stellaceae bacterium]|nr:type II toxin-antitoxin system VapC family toxin [Stellaceae bacterium]